MEISKTDLIVVSTSVAIIFGALFAYNIGRDKLKSKLYDYDSQLKMLSATPRQANGSEYLSVPFEGKEIKLFYYKGKWETPERIRSDEWSRLREQTDSYLIKLMQKYE